MFPTPSVKPLALLIYVLWTVPIGVEGKKFSFSTIRGKIGAIAGIVIGESLHLSGMCMLHHSRLRIGSFIGASFVLACFCGLCYWFCGMPRRRGPQHSSGVEPPKLESEGVQGAMSPRGDVSLRVSGTHLLECFSSIFRTLMRSNRYRNILPVSPERMLFDWCTISFTTLRVLLFPVDVCSSFC